MYIAPLKAACTSGLLLVALALSANSPPAGASTPAGAWPVPGLGSPTTIRGDGRLPDARHHGASLEPSNALANLGHEGSGLRRAESGVNALANLGHEGSGLMAAWQVAKLGPWAS
jgi:hypothetical protein